MRLNRKGFSLIEMIAVLAILSIIILITIPRFEPYKKYSRENELKHEILEVEYQIKKVIINNDLDSWNRTGIITGDDLWTSKGLYDNLSSGKYIEIPKKLLKTKLEGEFYLKDGIVYYSKNKLYIEKEPYNVGDKDSEDFDIVENEIKPTVNKTPLFELMNIAKGLNKEDYGEGWISFSATLAMVEETYLSETANQDKINRALMRLERAIIELNPIIEPI